MRQSTFTVDAEKVQGNEGATVTFRCLTVRAYREYRASPDIRDYDLVEAHIVSWTGIVGDDGKELPNPKDEPEIVNKLFLHEQGALAILLVQGPDGESAKN